MAILRALTAAATSGPAKCGSDGTIVRECDCGRRVLQSPCRPTVTVAIRANRAHPRRNWRPMSTPNVTVHCCRGHPDDRLSSDERRRTERRRNDVDRYRWERGDLAFLEGEFDAFARSLAA